MLREATHEDLPALVAMAAAMHAESVYHVLHFSSAKIEAHFAALIDSPAGFLRIVDRNGVAVAFMSAQLVQPYFTDEWIAQELLVYATPAFRGGMAAARLLTAFVQWAKPRDAKLILAGITTGITLDSTARLYETLGFDVMGLLFKWSDD